MEKLSGLLGGLKAVSLEVAVGLLLGIVLVVWLEFDSESRAGQALVVVVCVLLSIIVGEAWRRLARRRQPDGGSDAGSPP